MKNLFAILLILPFMFSCSSDKKDEVEPTQDYTSFVFLDNELDLPNVVVGYFSKDGNCIKIASLGDTKKGVASKEIKIDYNIIKEVYVFTDYISGRGESRMDDYTYILKEKKKNILTAPKDVKGIIVDKKDKSKYPH